jgi:aryl-phospho-beta-D-glucosidase BglC (GH1 family)
MAYNNGNSNGNASNGGMVRLGGLWKNQTKDGKTYLAGTFGGARVLIFPNGFKEKDTDPDFILNLAQNQPKEDKAQSQQRQPANDLF